MANPARSNSPTIVLRIHDGPSRVCRAFTDFSQAVRCAEAYADVGFIVDMVSATGRFIMGFEPRRYEIAV